MWSVCGQERRQCPPEYAERLRDIGGLNRFGEPNWRVVWGQTATEIVGGTWLVPTSGTHVELNKKGEIVEVPNTYEVAEMREVLKYDGRACWILERWFPPENYGTEFSWYRENADPKSGLSLLGRYPDDGFYECCYPLINPNGTAMELNDYVLNALVPLILKTHETTEAERKTASTAYRLKLEQDEHQRKVDMYVDLVPEADPISYAGQTNKTARRDRDRIAKAPLKNMPDKFGQVN